MRTTVTLDFQVHKYASSSLSVELYNQRALLAAFNLAMAGLARSTAGKKGDGDCLHSYVD